METKRALPKLGMPPTPYSMLRLRAIIAEMPKNVSSEIKLPRRSMFIRLPLQSCAAAHAVEQAGQPLRADHQHQDDDDKRDGWLKAEVEPKPIVEQLHQRVLGKGDHIGPQNGAGETGQPTKHGGG